MRDPLPSLCRQGSRWLLGTSCNCESRDTWVLLNFKATPHPGLTTGGIVLGVEGVVQGVPFPDISVCRQALGIQQ